MKMLFFQLPCQTPVTYRTFSPTNRMSAPRSCFSIISRARASRSLRIRSKFTRPCQSVPVVLRDSLGRRAALRGTAPRSGPESAAERAASLQQALAVRAARDAARAASRHDHHVLQTHAAAPADARDPDERLQGEDHPGLEHDR